MTATNPGVGAQELPRLLNKDDLLILDRTAVAQLLHGRERDVLEAVQGAYLAHARGQDALPESVFLGVPDGSRNRIIALPAYLSDSSPVAGLKWISSFPGNVTAGLERASALVILNSTETGRPMALLEGALLSAQRTAASAALAAGTLATREPVSAGMIGCGFINFEVVRFLKLVFRSLREVVLNDALPDRVEMFRLRCQDEFPDLRVRAAGSREELLRDAELVSLATTAAVPYIDDLTMFARGAVILHISLRDLTPNAILQGENLADDVDHVCRAQTSIHLAALRTGSRSFVRGTIGDILLGRLTPRQNADSKIIFNPFGLGILDIAVARLLYELAVTGQRGMRAFNFFAPPPPTRRAGECDSRV
jgi:N-[(2S)-2-amino-2-carboxyethyl]-L-glutamate dehydrogenase